MSMMMGWYKVARKEIRDSLRDRRTLFTTLLMGPVFGPFLIVGMMTFVADKETKKAEEALEIPIVNQSIAPNLVDFLVAQGVVVLDPPDDPEQAVRDEEHDAVIRITEQYPEQWRSGQPAVVELIADTSDRETSRTQTRIRQLLGGYGAQVGNLRLSLRGVDANLARAVRVKNVDLATSESRGAIFLASLPYLMMITVFVSGMSVAIDTTAGEKERHSLEPLLINPIPRWQFMVGKLVATTFFASVALALSISAFILTKDFLPSDLVNSELNLNWSLGLLYFVVSLPIAVVAASLLTMLAAFAKSYREAQSYMGLVVLIPMFPSLYILINPVKAQLAQMWFPLLSQNILINTYIRGESVPLSWLLVSIISSLAVGLILAAIAASLYNRPRLIFGGG